jgi:hypothetical protein
MEIEVHPDAWDRFRGAVHDMTKTGPQHRESPKTKRKLSRPKAASAKRSKRA